MRTVADQANIPDQPWAVPLQDVLRAQRVTPEQGLSESEVESRRRQFGPNHLRQVARKGALGILIDQFESLIVLLLAVAAVLSFAFDRWLEGAAIVVVLALVAIAGSFGIEWLVQRHRRTSP